MEKQQTRPFGKWDFYNEIPVSRGEQIFHKDVDLFKVPQSPLGYNFYKASNVVEKKHLHHHEHKKLRRSRCAVQEQKKRDPKALDEDLYKIPSEFLNQKPKSGTDFWKRCLSLSCIS